MTNGRALKFLDDTVFGLSHIVGTPKSVTINIEVSRNDAYRLAWEISRELEVFFPTVGRMPFKIELGRPFEYRGFVFRITEASV